MEKSVFSIMTYKLCVLRVDIVVPVVMKVLLVGTLSLGIRALVSGTVALVADQTHLGLENLLLVLANEANVVASDVTLNDCLGLRVVESLANELRVVLSHVSNDSV